MKRWLADTLFKRLFALMWLALVVSHVVAFLAVTHGRDIPRWPTFPSLPPFALGGSPPMRPDGEGDARWREEREHHPDAFGAEPDWARGARGEMPPVAEADGRGFPFRREGPHAGGMPGAAALLDYGIRLLIIGLAAWMGARWLSAPMRRLASASQRLGVALTRNDSPPQVDERSGTIEVRETAQVFNEMSRQLADQVNSRALLVAAISHDLRTPLTRIRMRLEAGAADPVTARSIADIHEMDDLIESALEVFRGPGHEEVPQATDVMALVQSLVDDLADLGQPVSVQGEPAPATVQAVALRRVVSNLVNNALRYGQRADLTVRRLPAAVQVEIADTGPGIPEALLEAVMKPFFRLESSRNRLTGGSGLGLYIARDLLARQGGTLALANRPEGGLQATITLPASE